MRRRPPPICFEPLGFLANFRNMAGVPLVIRASGHAAIFRPAAAERDPRPRRSGRAAAAAQGSHPDARSAPIFRMPGWGRRPGVHKVAESLDAADAEGAGLLGNLVLARIASAARPIDKGE